MESIHIVLWCHGDIPFVCESVRSKSIQTQISLSDSSPSILKFSKPRVGHCLRTSDILGITNMYRNMQYPGKIRTNLLGFEGMFGVSGHGSCGLRRSPRWTKDVACQGTIQFCFSFSIQNSVIANCRLYLMYHRSFGWYSYLVPLLHGGTFIWRTQTSNSKPGVNFRLG